MVTRMAQADGFLFIILYSLEDDRRFKAQPGALRPVKGDALVVDKAWTLAPMYDDQAWGRKKPTRPKPKRTPPRPSAKVAKTGTKAGTKAAKCFVCSWSNCGAMFTTDHKLKKHRQMHISDEHKCSKCKAKFDKEAQLKAHMTECQSTKKSSSGGFACTRCEKISSTRALAVEHEQTHGAVCGRDAYPIDLINAMIGQQDTAQRRMFELGKLAISAFRGKRSRNAKKAKKTTERSAKKNKKKRSKNEESGIMPGSLFIQKSAAPTPGDRTCSESSSSSSTDGSSTE